MSKIFLVSPASTSGKRAELLFNPRGDFDLARKLKSPGYAPLGEIFSFLSGLYFRGKLAYARHFESPPAGVRGHWIITSGLGLVPSDELISLAVLRSFSEVRIDNRDKRYREPLTRSATRIAKTLRPDAAVVLLGSIATDKYTETLVEVFGKRLLFPAGFLGRGDMSRGAMLLKAVRENEELEYRQVIETGECRDAL